MILSDTEILKAIEAGTIVIDPFDISCLGGNSYDVSLGPVLRVYDTKHTRKIAQQWGYKALFIDAPFSDASMTELDCAQEPTVLKINIPEAGIMLVPGILYLASTVEYTEAHAHVCYLDGRSSVGRLGISVHKTAGRGDTGDGKAGGWSNHWTLEIDVVQPVRIYAGMKIGQLTYHTVYGKVERTYAGKTSTTYGKMPRDPLPQPSRLWTKMTRKP